jgi:hypothetical protein
MGASTSGVDSIMFARQAEACVIRSVCNVHTHVQAHCIYESVRRECTHNLSVTFGSCLLTMHKSEITVYRYFHEN